jgi:hypothetical protein
MSRHEATVASQRRSKAQAPQVIGEFIGQIKQENFVYLAQAAVGIIGELQL